MAAVFLGLVLLVAAGAKAVDPEAFIEQIRDEGLAFFGLAAPVAFTAIAIEIALGTALALGMRHTGVLVPTALLVVFFLFLTGRAYWSFANGLTDESGSCGCFGNLVNRSPAEAFWQDLFVLGPPAILAFVGRARRRNRFPAKRLAAVGAMTISGLAFALCAPSLPIDDLATRLKPGVKIADLCAGAEGSSDRVCLDSIVSEAEEGSHWLILSDLDEASFERAMPDLNTMALENNGTGLWVVTSAPSETVAAFDWTQAPAFEVREAPAPLLRSLYRRLPRSFRVENGVVVETINGLPPLVDLITRNEPDNEHT